MLGLAVVTVGALVYTGYHAMAPRSQLYGRTFTGVDAETRQLALTFDDGPNDPHTLALLEVLAKHDVKSTFFLIGKYVERRPDIVREIVAAGHVVANHTYTHPNLIFQSQSQFNSELERCERALDDAVGENHAPLFRPPFGGRRPAVLRTLKKHGMKPILWSVTGFDWNAGSSEEIERNVTKRVCGGDVVLLHDGSHVKFGADRSFTVQATDRLIARYKREGYTVSTIPEMMRPPV